MGTQSTTRYHLLIRCVVCSITVVLGCTPDNGADQDMLDVLHPVERFRYRPIPVTSRIGIDAAPSAEGQAPGGLTTTLEGFAPDVTIGSLDGPAEVTFGQIADASFDGRGRLFVLDALNHAVRVFGAQGKYLFSVGSAGEGPGELSQPRAVALGDDGTLFVAGMARVDIWVPDGDSLEHQRRLNLEIDPEDLCWIDGHVYVTAPNPARHRLIHKVTIDGTVLSSFGEVYTSPSEFVNFHLRGARLACLSEPGIIAIAPTSLLGEVHAYDLDGKPLWIVGVDGYRPVAFAQGAGGGTTTRIPESGYDRVMALVADSGTGAFVVQVGYRSFADYQAKQEVTTMSTFWIDGESGQAHAGASGLPRLLVSGGNALVAARTDPYPVLYLDLTREE